MTEQLYPGSRHSLPVRRPHFPFDASIPKHWAGGNAVASHAFNGLQLCFPAGERFFIQSVKDLLPYVDDEALRRQARSFLGQEAMHTREHLRFNEILKAQGYRLEPFLGPFEKLIRFCGRRLPAKLRIAMTAGAEHYTAMLGTLALTRPVMRDQMHPTVAQLIVWHACEEVEHKAVAFDVMQAVGVGYPRRILGYLIITAVLVSSAILSTRMLLRQDGLSRREISALTKQLPGSRVSSIRREIRQGFRAYFRRDFHPNQQGDLGAARSELAKVGVDPGLA
ncbi:MAG: metal-dependent hydrolase [Myxococcota bacterium]